MVWFVVEAYCSRLVDMMEEEEAAWLTQTSIHSILQGRTYDW
jgi:hypothetical protein